MTEEVLAERLAGLDRRVAAIEQSLEKQRGDHVSVLVELKVLQTRVSLYAAAISFAVSTGVALLLKFAG